MKAIYGPVSSWRLGRSLGVDPICSEEKICSFDCVYCQLGKGRKTCERTEFISLEKLKEDFKLASDVKADIITFSGTGEPTLAENLGVMIDYIKQVSDLPLAVLTNSSLLSDEKVRNALYKLDVVVAKLDAPNDKLFRAINRPCKGISFDDYLRAIKEFRESYTGKFTLQMMFIEMNKGYAKEMAEIVRELNPDEVQINTPLRPCAVEPLNKDEIMGIKDIFTNLSDVDSVVCVYEAKRPKVKPIDMAEINKRKRPEP